MIENAADLIETKLRLLGATAIEDQLQDQVSKFIYIYIRVYIFHVYNVTFIII